jgi:hypothetical protein
MFQTIVLATSMLLAQDIEKEVTHTRIMINYYSLQDQYYQEILYMQGYLDGLQFTLEKIEEIK